MVLAILAGIHGNMETLICGYEKAVLFIKPPVQV